MKLVNLAGIKTIYFNKQNVRRDVSELRYGSLACGDMAQAIYRLQALVIDHGGSFYIIDCFRPWAVQEYAHNQYLRGLKSAFVSRPGSSFHQAGRAIDVDVYSLGISLLQFWDLAKPLGFMPIINLPEIRMSESWHFDFPGPWRSLYSKEPYGEVAKMAILDASQWDISDKLVKEKTVQARLWKLGFPCGEIDGVIGEKTRKSIAMLGLNPDMNIDALMDDLGDRQT